MNAQRRDSIMELVGADDWGMVGGAFGGKSADDIEFELDEMYAEDDNAELAEMIYEELR